MKRQFDILLICFIILISFSLIPINESAKFRLFRQLWSTTKAAIVQPKSTTPTPPLMHRSGSGAHFSHSRVNNGSTTAGLSETIAGVHVPTQLEIKEVLIASQAQNVSLEHLKDQFRNFHPEFLEYIHREQTHMRQLSPPTEVEPTLISDPTSPPSFNNASTYFSLIHSLRNPQNSQNSDAAATAGSDEEISPFEVLMQNHKTMAYLKFDPTGKDLLKCLLFDSEKDPLASEMIAKLIRRRPPMIANNQQMMDAIRHCTEFARVTLIRNGFLPSNDSMSIERVSRNPSETRYSSNITQPLNVPMIPPSNLTAPQIPHGDTGSNFFSFWKGILPGTKWCGLGDAASNYDDLGEKADIDICCRAHDHCPIRLKAWHLGWNTLNFSFYTKSSCDCDEDFYRCLKRSPNSYASALGNFYFNILKVQCLRPKRTCQQRADCDDFKIDYFGRQFK